MQTVQAIQATEVEENLYDLTYTEEQKQEIEELLYSENNPIFATEKEARIFFWDKLKVYDGLMGLRSVYQHLVRFEIKSEIDTDEKKKYIQELLTQCAITLGLNITIDIFYAFTEKEREAAVDTIKRALQIQRPIIEVITIFKDRIDNKRSLPIC